MKSMLLKRCAVAAALSAAAAPHCSYAVTVPLTRTIENNQTNRPFFSQAAFPTFANEAGYVGSAAPGATSSTVTNPDVGVGGNLAPSNLSNNNVPLGVGLSLSASFTVQTVVAGHVLSDGGNPGLAINSSVPGPDPQTAQLNAGEKLRFSNVSLGTLSIRDPLGLLVPGSVTVSNPLWRSLRSNTNQANNSPTVTVSSDEAQTTGVFNFAPSGAQGTILNGTAGVFTPITPLYVGTNTGNNWPLKAIAFQMDLNYELAPVPAARRTIYFGGSYGDITVNPTPITSHQLTAGDTTISFQSIGGAGMRLDSNDLGVGVNSDEDNLTNGLATSNANQRFIDGSLTAPESIRFSFDRKVELESLTLGNLDLNGTEGVKLEFVTGTNPFTGLTGYSGDYTLDANSLTFKSSAGGQTPYAFTYGKNGQSPIIIEQGTVLALTSSPSANNGFILDMMTVRIPGALPTAHANFDNDADVDGADFDIWAANVGSTTATAASGDTDLDGDADGSDFLQWQREFTGPAAFVAAPEPSAVALFLLAAPFVRFARRRNL